MPFIIGIDSGQIQAVGGGHTKVNISMIRLQGGSSINRSNVFMVYDTIAVSICRFTTLHVVRFVSVYSL